MGEKIEELCRLCAGTDPVKLPIFSSEGKQRNLLVKIQTCLRFKVTEEDGYPSSICYSCMFNLDNYYQFHESCLKAQSLLQSKLVAVVNNDHHDKMSVGGKADAVRPFPCDLCPTSFMSAQDRWTHVSQNHKGDARITCIFCRKGFSTVANLNFHKKNKHASELEELERKIKPLPPLQKINELANSLPARVNHNHGRINAFDTVQTFFNNKSDPARHDLTNFNLKIGNTDIKFGNTNITIGSTDISLGRTTEQNSNNKSMIDRLKNLGVEVSTGATGATGATVSQLHMKNNNELNSVNERIRKNINAQRLMQQQQQQQQQPPQQSFQNPEDLLELDLELESGENLENMIESESVFGCEVCYRDFKDRSSLWLHMIYSHKNEAGYTCGICLKLCPSYRQLQEHVVSCKDDTEAEKRRYYCLICYRQHESRKKLESHTSIHNLNDEYIRENFDLNNLVAVNPTMIDKNKYDEQDASEFSDTYSQEMDVTNDSTQNSYFGQNYYDDTQNYKDQLAYQSFLEGSGHFLESSSFFDNVKTDEEKKEENSEANQFRCDECYRTYETSLQLTKHKYNVHKNPSRLQYRNDSFGNPVYECEYCGQTYESPKQLTKHRYNVHKYQAVVSSGVDEQGKPLFGCNECPRMFETPRQLQKHKYNVHKIMNRKLPGCDSPSSVDSAKPASFHYSSFDCEICGDKLGSKTERWKHCYIKHQDEVKLKCTHDGCGKIMPTEAFKNEHLTFHEQQGQYPICCEICSKIFTTKLEFWKHVSGVHFSLIGLTCGVCMKMFLSLEELKEHIKLHEPLSEAEFNCDICGRGYSSKPKMARHRLVHENDPENDEYNILKNTLLQGNISADKKYEILNIPKVNRQFSDLEIIEVNPDDNSSFVDMSEDNIADNLWCDVCPDMTFNDLDELRTHRRNIHALYPCDLCPKFYGGVSHLWKHANRCHKGHPDITCNVCNKTSASRIQLRGHINKNHKERLMGHVVSDGSQPLDLLPDPDPTNLHCQRCGREFRIRSLVRRHEKTCLNKTNFDPDPTNLNCQRCGKYYPIRSLVRRHEKVCLNKVIKDPLSLKCKLCGKEFPKRSYCRRHERTCGTKKDKIPKDENCEVTCEFCQKVFNNRRAYASHVDYMHSIVDCEICQDTEERSSFRSKTDLYNHCKEKHGDHPDLLCKVDKCKRLLRTKGDLEKHMRDHKNRDNPPTCEFCADIFKGRKKLRIHMLHQHKNEETRKFVCGVCVKVHEDTESLMAHVYELHAKFLDRDFTCKICAKQYNVVSKVLEHHRTTHSQDYKPCKFCLRVFTDDALLDEHVKQHEKGERITADTYNTNQCSICLQTFDTVVLMYEHMKENHPQLPENSCCICGKRYQSIYTCHDHMENKHGNTFLACRKCLQVFTDVESKAEHMLIHGVQDEQDNLICNLCSKKNTSELELEEHIKSDHGEYFDEKTDRNLCLICSKVLKYKYSIFVHVEKHHPNNFCCRSCLMIYKTKEELKEHFDRLHVKVTNSPITPNSNKFNFMKKSASQSIKRIKNQCFVCQNVEGDTKSLHRHVEKEHPFVMTRDDTCYICGQRYSSRHKVFTHVTSYHGPPYTCCKKCLKIFTSEEDLNSHVTSEHQDNEQESNAKQVNNKRKRKATSTDSAAPTPKRKTAKSRMQNSSTENESLTTTDNDMKDGSDLDEDEDEIEEEEEEEEERNVSEDEGTEEEEDEEENEEDDDEDEEEEKKKDGEDYVCELGNKNEQFKIKIKHNINKKDDSEVENVVNNCVNDSNSSNKMKKSVDYCSNEESVEDNVNNLMQDIKSLTSYGAQ